MPPIVVHQSKEYSQDLHHNIPLDWTVHRTPYVYMDIDRWLKAMVQFSNICRDSPFNNQTLFFNGHVSHFNGRALIQRQSKNIQPFILKSGDSINGHPNDNGPNSTLKALCNVWKAKWMLKYRTTTFQPHHMNNVIFETWEDFTVSSGNIITDSFLKLIHSPLAHPIS